MKILILSFILAVSVVGLSSCAEKLAGAPGSSGTTVFPNLSF